jgi:hypothetical protein
MDFNITYEIAGVLENLMLSMSWVTLRHALMSMVGISSRPSMMVHVLALPHRQHTAPSCLMELETLPVL